MDGTETLLAQKRRDGSGTALATREPARTLTAVRVDQHPVTVYLSRLSPGSRRTMKEALGVIARLLTGADANAWDLDWPQFEYQHATAVRQALAERYAPNMANKCLAALRGVLRESRRLGLMSADQYAKATDLAAVRGARVPRGRALPVGEVRALFLACADDPRPQGRRDAAMIAVLYGTGLRAHELVRLDLADYDAVTGALRIHGKGGKERLAYVNGGTTQALAAWLEVRGGEAGPLFVPIDQAGRLRRERATPAMAWVMLRTRARDASVLTPFSPHDLRRTFVSDMLDEGVDLSVVQALAGHANIQTTARYDRRGEAAKQHASKRRHVPFVPAHQAGGR